MSWLDGLFSSDQDNEPTEDQTVTLAGLWTPEFQKAIDDMHRHFGDEEGA